MTFTSMTEVVNGKKKDHNSIKVNTILLCKFYIQSVEKTDRVFLSS